MKSFDNTKKAKLLKILVVGISILIVSVIQTAIRFAGYILGGLPTFILFGSAGFIALYICKKIDKKYALKDDQQNKNIIYTDTEREMFENKWENEKKELNDSMSSTDRKTDEDSISKLAQEMKQEKKMRDQQDASIRLVEEAIEKGISVEQLMYMKKLERALEEKKEKGKIRDTLMAINEWVAIVLSCIYALMCFELYNITATKGEYIAFIGYTCFHYFAALIILYIAVRGILCFAEYIAKKVFKSSKIENSAIVSSSDLSRNRLIIALGCPIVIIISKILL